MFFVRLAEFVLRQRILIALILGIMLVVALNGASRVVPDFTLTAFFGGNDPAREYLDTYIEKWGPDDAVILVIITAEDGTILTRERLQIIEEVSQALQSKKESVKTTRSISNMERVLSRNEADVSVLETRKVLETMPSDTDEESVAWKTWRAELQSDPLLSPLFISKDGKGSGMVLDLQKSTDNVIVVGPMVDEIRAVLESFNGRAGLHFATAGMPAVRADFFALFFQDSKLFGGLSFVMVFFCMLFVFRSVHGVIIPSIAAGFPVMMVFGLMGYSGENMGIINQSYITVLPAIAIADAIHLLTRFHEEARRMAAPGERLTPEQRENAIKKALSKVGVACLLTSLTTAVGFGSLYVAEMPTIQSFGYFAGLGIIFAYGSILFIIPLCLSFVRGIPKEREDKAPWLDRILKRCAQISIYRPGIVLFATTLIVAGCIYLGSFVVLDNQITNLLDEEHPTTQANLILDEKLGGHLTLEIDFVDHHPPLPPADLGVFEEELDEEEIVFDLEEDFDDSPQEVAITNKEEDVRPTPMLKNAEILRAMYAVERWAYTQEFVRFVVSPATYIATSNALMTGGGVRAEEVGIPTEKGQVGHLFEQLQGSDELDRVQRNYDTWGRMIVRLSDVGGVAFDQFAHDLEGVIAKEMGHLPLDSHLSGTPYIAYRGINNITTDLRNSLILAFFVIAIVIAILLKNLRMAVVCLVPNALPLLVGYGMMGAMEWMLEPSAALVFTVALGIAVDDTLHLVVRCREELGKGVSLEDALAAAVLHCGRAVSITTLILCCAFGIVGLSSFSQMMIMGSLGSVVIFAALLCDVFVLPSLLILFGKGAWVSKHQGIVPHA